MQKNLYKVKRLFDLVGELAALWSNLDKDEKDLIQVFMQYDEKKEKYKSVRNKFC